MAFDGRRTTLLSNLDVNNVHANHAGASTSQTGLPKMARSSMIPRQSVVPFLQQQQQQQHPASLREIGGTSMRASAISRSSIAPAAYAAVGGGGGDAENWAPHSVSNTPHHLNASFAAARRGEASTSRLSMAPPQSQQHTYGLEMKAAGRSSMLVPAQTPNSRKSMGRPSYAPSRGGLASSTGQKASMVDPRPIREDRSYLACMEAEIQDFLVQSGFTFPQKYNGAFHLPSQALVMSAFRHLYHRCVDLRHVFNAEPKKEVEEVLQVLGDIRYPLMTELSKTKLSAPGTIHNWPPICGMLHWMVCLETSMERVTTKYHGGPLERPVSDEDEDFCHYFPYLWHCYEQFWQSKDDYPEEQAKLEKIFEDKSHRARQDVERLQVELQDAHEKLSELEKTDAPLEIELKEKQVLESDLKKFIEYRDTVLLPRIQQNRTAAEKLKADAVTHSDAIATQTQKRDKLREEVDAQNVSADDFESMSREREALARQVEDVTNKLLDRSATNGHSEISLSNKQARVEDELKALSDRCREIDMFPFVNEGRQFFDFEMHAGNAATMLPHGLNIRQDVKRRITEKREALKQEYREVASVKVKDQEAYDMLLEEVEEKREALERLDTRLNSVREQTEMANAASKDENRIQADMEAKNELALAQMDQAGRANVDQAEARLQSARMQLSLVKERDILLRKQMHEEFVAGLENVLTLKSTVTEGLQALEEAADRCA